ncbi:hypothetical protein K8B33_04555 [Alcanivorax sp. JB21]|uniref:glycerophosphodiester phosphodiesterase n=1 Tax=Alcanivorax limicola TaxID=2874102 RepID=UPI001CC0DBC8|nr:glycerophosphodiester phosphodiesterase family protein [Alcanivorax limicola]MBZ2188352.1 hypothetical protein [Alcanivorax limicola]
MTPIVWISHRGLNERYAENSLLAFRAAVDAGFTHLETDLRCTSDGHLVLHHDPHMGRTAGNPAAIHTLTLAEFRNARLADGQVPPLFTEFAEQFDRQSWILDIKPERGAETLKLLHDWAQRHGAGGWLTRKARFLLWAPQHYPLLARYFPDAVTMADQRECRRAGLSVLCGMSQLGNICRNRTYSIPPRYFGLNLLRRSVIRAYQRHGARVLAFLPESPADVEKALANGANEILINGRAPL